MKKIFTLLLIAETFTYSRAQTCNPLDNSFGNNGKAIGYSTANDWLGAENLLVQSDSKIIQIGTKYNSGLLAVRYDSNGSIDNSYGQNGVVMAFSGQNNLSTMYGALQRDEKLVIAGTVYNNNTYQGDIALARFNTDGSLDNSFGLGGKVVVPVISSHDVAKRLAFQSDGKIVVAGYSTGNCFTDCKGRSYCRPLFTAWRFSSIGAIDTTFGQNGKIVLSPGSFNSGIASSVLIQSDGKIVVTGEIQHYDCDDYYGGGTFSSGFLMVRFHPNGTPDITFGQNGQVIDTLILQAANAAVRQPDDKIIVAGYQYQGGFITRRYNSNGTVDNGFVQNVITTGWVNTMTLLPDGKIALGGGSAITGQHNFFVTRLTNDGNFDSSFNGNGRLEFHVGPSADSYEDISGLAVQGSQLLAGGLISNSSNNSNQSSLAVVRLGQVVTGISVSISPPGPLYPCEGQTITLTANRQGSYQWFKNGAAISGATGPVYQVSSSGIYVASLTNGSGCGLSDAVQVQVNGLPVIITPLSSLSFCEGDSVKLLSGETGTIQWYKDNSLIPGATDSIFVAKTSGSYYVTVKNAKSCGQSSPVNVAVTVGKPSIQWDGIRLNTVSGYYSYQWYLNGIAIAGATSNVIQPAATGLYKVVIADYGCNVSSDEFNLNCSVIALSKPDIHWNGLYLTTLPGYASYQWYLDNNLIAGASSGSFQPVHTGTYRVEATDWMNCTSTSLDYVLGCDQVGPFQPSIRWDGTTFSTDAGYSLYQWYRNDTLLSGATAQIYTPVFGEFGNYKVTVTNHFGCSNTSTSVSYHINVFTLGDVFFSCYPNPAKAAIFIHVSQPLNQALTVEVYDLRGRRLLRQSLKGGRNSLPVQQLPSAMYILEIRYGTEKKALKALVLR